MPRSTDTQGKPSDDSRFIDSSGTVQLIATSNAQNDSGLFELNFRDERYLPFEGAGAISTWRLELSGKWQNADGNIVELAQFDFNTISDVILHLRYTARDGGDLLKNSAIDALMKNLDAMMKLAEDSGGFYRLFSLRHDFPTEWAAFVNGTGDFTATIRKDYFPYFTQGKQINIESLDLYDGEDVSKHHGVVNANNADAATTTTTATNQLADQGKFTLDLEPDPQEPTQVLTRMANSEVILIVRYSLQL